MGFNLEEKIEEWRTQASSSSFAAATAAAVDSDHSLTTPPGNGGGGGGGLEAEGGEAALSRVEFTRTHTAVVDIL